MTASATVNLALAEAKLQLDKYAPKVSAASALLVSHAPRMGSSYAVVCKQALVDFLTPQVFNRLLRELTITVRSKFGAGKLFQLWKQVSGEKYADGTDGPQRLLLPKGYFERLAIKYQIPMELIPLKCDTQMSAATPAAASLPPDETTCLACCDDAKLLPAQEDYVERTMLAFEQSMSKNVLIVQETGGGKSFIAMGIMARLQVRTLIVIPRHSLEEQWKKNLESWFKDATIATLASSVGDLEVASVVVAVINSVVAKPKEWFAQFGLCVLDEVHMYCTEAFSEVFWLAQCRYTVALTATPKRLDGLQRFLELHFCTTLTENPSIPIQVTPWLGVCHALSYHGPPEFTKHIKSVTGMTSFPLMLNQVANDPYRNRLIANITLGLSQRHNVFVMTDRLEQLRHVYDLIAAAKAHVIAPELGIAPAALAEAPAEASAAPAAPVALLSGGASKDEIKNAAELASILLTTIQYSGTGLSIDRMTAMVMGTPRRHGMQQILGRIFRQGYHTETTRELVDIIDAEVTIRTQYTERKREYKRRKMPIVEADVSWEQLK